MDFKTFSSMDTESLIITILINFLITAVAYLFVPSVLSIAKAKFFSSTIKTIAIINGIVVSIVFGVIGINLGIRETFNFAPAFLWSAIAYALMKKFCLYTEDDFNEIFEDDDSNEKVETEKPVEETRVNLSWENEHHTRQSSLTYGDDIRFDSQTQHDTEPNFDQIKHYAQPLKNEEKTKGRRKSILIFSAIVLVLIMLITSFVFNIIQYNKNSELKKATTRWKSIILT